MMLHKDENGWIQREDEQRWQKLRYVLCFVRVDSLAPIKCSMANKLSQRFTPGTENFSSGSRKWTSGEGAVLDENEA